MGWCNVAKLKFKKRIETNKVVVQAIDAPSYEVYFNELRRRGELDTGCHYFIDEYGEIKRERAIDVVAGWHYEEGDSSIYILVQCQSKKLSSCQKFAVKELLENIKKKYPKIKVVNKNG